MKCPKCDSEIPADGDFCPNCHETVAKICPECRTNCGLNDQFCRKCGHHFNISAIPPESQDHPSLPPLPSLAREPEAEVVHKQATALIADLKSSTNAILAPDEAREVLTPAMEKLSSLVYEYGGMVISSAVDGLAAVFVPTQGLENSAMRACLAALAIQIQIPPINKDLVVRIGMDTGEIPVSADGSKYDVDNPVIVLAGKMQQMAKPGTIQLTQNTLKQVEKSATVESLGKLEMKGFTDLIEAFELKELKVGKSLNILENQFLERNRFVNREQEFKQLEFLLLLAKDSHGNTVSLCAPTGTGKSRFTYEFINSNTAKDCNILLTVGSGFIHTKTIPLLPVKNLFLNLFGLLKGENNIESIKPLIQPFIAKINTPYAFNAALSLIHLNPNDSEWNTLEPGLKRRYIFETGAEILFNYSVETPLILIFEDIHWMDNESELFLDLLIAKVGKWKILILITFRPEYHDHWVGQPNYTRILLKPLTNEACSQMLENLLGTDPALAEIKMKLLSTAKGNPFFLEELVLSLIKEKILIGKQHDYHLHELTAVAELHFPESLVGVYQMKIDSLRPIEKKILQVASVIGTKFLYSQLIQLLETVDESEVRMALNRLTDNQYIYESQLYPEPGFSFTYPLTLETSYNSLLKKTRKALHLKLFQILESSLNEDRIDQMQILAEHAYLGEIWEKAFYYYIKTAEKVIEINAFTSSAQLYEKALITADHLPQTEDLILKTMKIHYALYYVYVPLGRFKKQQEHLDKALEIALAKKNRLFESLIHSAICVHYMGYKNVNEAFQHAEKAYQIAKELQSKDAIAIAQFSLVNVNFFLGQFEELFINDQELEKTAGDLDFRSEYLKLPICQMARAYESWTRSFTGAFDVVEARKEKWFAESKNINQPSIGNACRFGSMGLNYYLKGEFEKGLEYTLSGLQFSLAAELIIFVPLFFALASNMFLRLNRAEEGKEYLSRAMATADKISAAYVAAPSMITISECLLMVGEYEKGKEYCDKAIKMMLERQIMPVYALLLRISAELDLALPDPDIEQIKRKFNEALGLLTKMGMWVYVGRVYLSLSTLYQKMGDKENRKIQLKSALAIFEKYKMAYWVDQANAALNE